MLNNVLKFDLHKDIFEYDVSEKFFLVWATVKIFENHRNKLMVSNYGVVVSGGKR